MRTGYRFVMAALVVGLIVLGSVVESGAYSPLNLSPGYPTSLDDAYPVPHKEWVVQSGARVDVFRSATRTRVPVDARYGIAKDVEVDLGGTVLRGPLTPGTQEDPRSIRVGGLARMYRDDQLSVGARVQAQIPTGGERRSPSLKSTLLASWDLGSQRYWHVNASYEAAPSSQRGQWRAGGTSQWTGVTGVVWGVDTVPMAVVADVKASNVRGTGNPAKDREITVTPEVGVVIPISKHLHVQASISRDFGGAPSSQASINGWVGITVTWT
ncbi:MAG: hypothetical protein AB1411_02495 [Nitrospirota bacterium]